MIGARYSPGPWEVLSLGLLDEARLVQMLAILWNPLNHRSSAKEDITSSPAAGG
jgi:hypothetical protein